MSSTWSDVAKVIKWPALEPQLIDVCQKIYLIVQNLSLTHPMRICSDLNDSSQLLSKLLTLYVWEAGCVSTCMWLRVYVFVLTVNLWTSYNVHHSTLSLALIDMLHQYGWKSTISLYVVCFVCGYSGVCVCVCVYKTWRDKDVDEIGTLHPLMLLCSLKSSRLCFLPKYISCKFVPWAFQAQFYHSLNLYWKGVTLIQHILSLKSGRAGDGGIVCKPVGSIANPLDVVLVGL